MSDSFDLQHVNVKFFVKDAGAVNLGEAINVFHSWIQGQKLDDLLIDVADYRHVPSGPGVILVGHNAQYSFDNAEDQLGVLYNRKTPMDASGPALIQKAIEVAREICQLLLKEEAFAGKLSFETSRLQILINDRLIGANDEATFERLLPDLTAALVAVFGEQEFKFERASDPRKRLTLTVSAAQGLAV